MANNCLVTKLKSVVDNENLDYLDKIKLSIKLKSGFPSVETNALYVGYTAPVVIENLNTDGALVRMDGNYLAITKGSSDTINILISKYIVSSINAAMNNYVGVKIEECSKFYDIKAFTCDGTLEDSIANVVNFRCLEIFRITNKQTEFVDIDVLTKVPSLKTVELHYCSVGGDLSSIKDMPNLETVVLDHTYVTDENDAITYMRNRGITVTYTPNT